MSKNKQYGAAKAGNTAQIPATTLNAIADNSGALAEAFKDLKAELAEQRALIAQLLREQKACQTLVFLSINTRFFTNIHLSEAQAERDALLCALARAQTAVDLKKVGPLGLGGI